MSEERYLVKILKGDVVQHLEYVDDRTVLGNDLFGTISIFDGKIENCELHAGLHATIEKMDTDKGLKYDVDKLRFDLVDPKFEEGLVEILTMGAAKYKPNSWQNIEDAKERYYSALRRHISAYRKGEAVDEESGYSHLLHACCNLMFLAYFERNEKNPPA